MANLAKNPMKSPIGWDWFVKNDTFRCSKLVVWMGFSDTKIHLFSRCVTPNWSHPYSRSEIGGLVYDFGPEKSVNGGVCHPLAKSGMSPGTKSPIQCPLNCHELRICHFKGPWMGILWPTDMPEWRFWHFWQKPSKTSPFLAEFGQNGQKYPKITVLTDKMGPKSPSRAL